MTRELRRTAQAEEDLIDLWLFIAKDNVKSADRIIRNLDNRAHDLREFPELGPARDDIAQNLRYLIVGIHLILYRVMPDAIEVVRYLHGARELTILTL